MSQSVTAGGFEFKRWKSGTEYENWVKDTLTELHFKAERKGKNDSGVDIIAETNWEGKKHRFYIQCKHYNKPVGKGPIQEIYAGTAFYRDYGSPVFVTSNTVTFEARLYARELGVEIISDPEWEEFARIVAEKKDDNPNPRIIQRWVVVLFLYTGMVTVWYYGIEKYLKKMCEILVQKLCI